MSMTRLKDSKGCNALERSSTQTVYFSFHFSLFMTDFLGKGGNISDQYSYLFIFLHFVLLFCFVLFSFAGALVVANG